MNKQSKLILTTVLVGSTLVGMGAFASTFNSATSMGNHKGKGMIMSGSMSCCDKGEMIDKFIVLDNLTEQEKTDLAALKTKHQEEMKALMEGVTDMKSMTDEEKASYKAKMTEMREKHLQEMKVFVDDDKLAEFEEFAAKQPQGMMGMGRGEGMGRDMGHGRKNNGGKGKMMSGDNQGIMIDKFIVLDNLTEQEKTDLAALKTKHQEEMKTLMEGVTDMRSMTDAEKESHKAKMTELRTKHLQEMKVFVDEDKLAEFEEFAAKDPQGMMGMGRGEGMNGKMGNNRENQKSVEKKGFGGKYIKGTTLTKIQTIIAGLSEDKLNSIIEKLDVLIEKLPEDVSQNKLGMYKELRDIINDALNSSSQDEEIINLLTN
ncbi:MAG: hypothetical protein V3575_06750 [Candidatus Absconditabacteria bacterium]